MSPTSCSAGRLAALVLAGLVLTSGCGLPTQGTETIETADVPYNLLGGTDETVAPAPTGAIAYWVTGAGMLVPRTVPGDCSDEPSAYLGQVLTALTDGPAADDRTGGLSTAVPPDAVLGLRSVFDGVAQLDFETPSPIGADRLPLAVAQIVLTVTTSPEVTDVTLFSDGEEIQVPAADGALTSPPVGAQEYADLVPERYRDRGAGSTGHEGAPRC